MRPQFSGAPRYQFKGDTTWQTARNARILRALVKFNRKSTAARNAKRWKKLRISTAVAAIRVAVAKRPEIRRFRSLRLFPARQRPTTQENFRGPRTQIYRERDSVAAVTAQDYDVCALRM